MKVSKASFETYQGHNALYYTIGKNDYAAPLPKPDLLQVLKESGFIVDHNGEDVCISIIDENETWMPLTEFLPLMSVQSWKEVALFIENTKTANHATAI